MNFGPALTTAGQIGSGAAGYQPQAEMAWQRVLQGRQQLQEMARRQQASEAFFKSLISPPEAAMPQQGPQGMPSMAPPAAPTPMAPGATAGVSGAPGTPSGPAPMPNAPMGGGPGPTPPAATGQPPAAGQPALTLPDPVARLRQMAQVLKRSNPGLDDATLAAALEQQASTARGLSGEDRAILQAETQIMRIQSQAEASIRAANSREEQARIRAESAEKIADVRTQAYRDAFAQASADRRRGQDITSDDRQRGQDIASDDREQADDTRRRGQDLTHDDRTVSNATRQRGQDLSHEDRQSAESGRNSRAGAAEAGRNARAAARIDASKADPGVKQQYKSLMAQRAAIKDKISAFNAGTPGAPKKEEVAQLQQQLQDLDGKVSALWSRNQTLPRPSELDRMPGDEAAKPTDAAPAEPAAGGIPDDAPTATDAKGNKVYWNGKAWQPAPKG